MQISQETHKFTEQEQANLLYSNLKVCHSYTLSTVFLGDY